MADSRPKVVDLFAGAGLFSFAFRKAGCTVIRAIEKDPTAAATYFANMGDHIEVGDVAEIPPQGRCDILISGPPCQGFSTLGGRRRDDARNALSLQVVRWARVLRPKVVVIENVPAFLQSAQWRTVATRLESNDFRVYSFVLDAVDFGCPQFRRRSFTIATATSAVPAARAKGSGPKNVQEAWRGLPSKPNGENHHYAPKPSPIALARMRVIPPGGDKRNVMAKSPGLAPPSWWRLNCQVTDAWGRMEWQSPCNTLRTGLQNASKGRYIHPEQNRVISLREAARLQTIPDSWSFRGLPTQVARQIGNSVPPSLGSAVASMVMQNL
jgi:DNA (cytosine-5)-methyltransferase 1